MKSLTDLPVIVKLTPNVGEIAESVEARAVQIGTVNFVNPCTTMDVLKGIENYILRHEVTDINGLIGTLRDGAAGEW